VAFRALLLVVVVVVFGVGITVVSVVRGITRFTRRGSP